MEDALSGLSDTPQQPFAEVKTFSPVTPAFAKSTGVDDNRVISPCVQDLSDGSQPSEQHRCHQLGMTPQILGHRMGKAKATARVKPDFAFLEPTQFPRQLLDETITTRPFQRAPLSDGKRGGVVNNVHTLKGLR
jgi:hypothetical protein